MTFMACEKGADMQEKKILDPKMVITTIDQINEIFFPPELLARVEAMTSENENEGWEDFLAEIDRILGDDFR